MSQSIEIGDANSSCVQILCDCLAATLSGEVNAGTGAHRVATDPMLKRYHRF